MSEAAAVQLSLQDPPGWKPGDLIPSRGASRCYGCHFPWWAARSYHSVPTDETGRSHMFALCQHCWDHTGTDERLTAYRWLIDQWVAMGTPADQAEQEWVIASAYIRAAGSADPKDPR